MEHTNATIHTIEIFLTMLHCLTCLYNSVYQAMDLVLAGLFCGVVSIIFLVSFMRFVMRFYYELRRCGLQDTPRKAGGKGLSLLSFPI